MVAPPPGTPDAAAEARRRKRSVAISLVLVAGAGTAALVLAGLDPSQKEEDALVYENPAACAAQGLRSAEACTTDHAAALAAYASSAPRYRTLDECRGHHGPDGCVAGETVVADAAGFFVPVMAAYLLGRTVEQALPPQPLYRHADEATGGGGGYCTGAGGRVFAARGGGATHVASRVARATPSSPRTVTSGGFGATGRAFSSASGSRSGGFGGG
ncbi:MULTISPECIES: DUF1190 domain-containing protein [unclassified Methylobacterium]|uniref:DUF1190 domain-containing protein n=1 Tax=unclassified Methylobacterium TaxID=2615210 RepID=UPI0006FC12C8|nr:MULTISPECIES: DUF1190 domain-containing protein [unclassified Methylobacterium]KQO65856.1 hypothetical protein ASF22_03985 [Methylobacterium sp. Leaf87]KQP18961.1 hypothetical protein ASF25_11180 [Methylobacterium sp. Leaf100]USU33819.1 DUF1190 domain-containing protein [Methylobacterium sp. OTU13CASTA1]